MKCAKCDIAMIGLGTMGRNLVLNMADHGFSVVGFDVDAAKVGQLEAEAAGKGVCGARRLKDLVGMLRRPRAVMLLVPAGKIVNQVIGRLAPLLAKGDVIVDGGNSHYVDTDRRAALLAKRGLGFLGVGVSGGEEGARRGPSLMPGGPRKAYARVRPIFEAIAARADGQPCVTYLGPGSAGHYVKMVHNGIEYGLMRLIAETYDLMKRALRFSNDELADVYADLEPEGTPGVPHRDHRSHLQAGRREDRRAADRRDPRRGGGPGHRPLDLRERDGAARARAHHRHGGGDARTSRAASGAARMRPGFCGGPTPCTAASPRTSSRAWKVRFTWG